MATALVTGASRGLGLEFTRQLLNWNMTVLAAARDPEASDGLTSMASTSERLIPISLDVDDPESVAGLPERVTPHAKSINLLVNNAGINSGAFPEAKKNRSLGTLEPEGMMKMLAVNAVGPILVTQCLLPFLEAAPWAKVLNISSWLGSISNKTTGGNYGYSASKAALNMLGRILAFDLKERGIHSAMFNPGWVKTDMGGPRAALTAEQSVTGILKFAEKLGDDQVGGFFDHNGDPHPW